MSRWSKYFLRKIYLWWAKIGIAHNHLNEILLKQGQSLYTETLIRKLPTGKTFNCDIRDQMQLQVFFFGSYQPNDCFVLCSQIKQGMVVMDAGANIGFFTLQMAEKVNESGKIYAFEHTFYNFHQLESHVKQNRLARIIKVELMALWHRTEDLFVSSTTHIDISSKLQISGVKNSESRLHLLCPGLTLDAYRKSKKIKVVHILKLSMEGAELYTLIGAEKTLRKDKPLIFLEVCSESCKIYDYSGDAIWQYLKKFGYHAFVFDISRLRQLENFHGLARQNVFLSTNANFAMEIDALLKKNSKVA